MRGCVCAWLWVVGDIDEVCVGLQGGAGCYLIQGRVDCVNIRLDANRRQSKAGRRGGI